MWCSCVQGLALYINADIKLEGNREAVIKDGDFFYQLPDECLFAIDVNG